jgi:hypothetical protein
MLRFLQQAYGPLCSETCSEMQALSKIHVRSFASSAGQLIVSHRGPTAAPPAVTL